MRGEWSDLRIFLAVARAGSTAAAGRALRLNQTTCARRLTALEAALGASLFERHAQGYRLTALGQALVEPATAMEAAAAAVEARLDEARRQAEGHIRFTTSEWIAETIAQPSLLRFTRDHPEIRISLTVEDRALDLAAGEADVAMRVAYGLDGPGLVARRVSSIPFALYCAADAVPPAGLADALGRPLAAPAGQGEALLRRLRPDARIGYVSNSMVALAEAVAGGGFVGLLPVWLARSRGGLRFCCGLEQAMPSLWIVFPERLRAAAHLRAFTRHLARDAKAGCGG